MSVDLRDNPLDEESRGSLLEQLKAKKVRVTF
jgi:hypothetical protein